MSVRRTIENVQQCINEIHGVDVITLDPKSYQGLKAKCHMTDVEFGVWQAKPENILSGQGHPDRKKLKIRRKLDDSLRSELAVVLGENAQIDESTYICVSKHARFVDKEFGEWFAKPAHILSGHGHPLRGIQQRSLSHIVHINEIIDRINKIHGDNLIIDAMTYKGSRPKARFIDVEYGEWWVSPNTILNGHGHPARGYREQSRTLRKHPPIIHWKTNKECYSQSSYEFAVLLWLNFNNYDFSWQVPFTTPFKQIKRDHESIYIIDLYIKSGPFADKYVEIKGYWRSEESKKKWNWFHSQNLNSELWQKNRLIELGILDHKGKIVYNGT